MTMRSQTSKRSLVGVSVTSAARLAAAALVALVAYGIAAPGQASTAAALPQRPAPVATQCATPTPTTASGYAAMWDSLPESQWGAADVSISAVLPDGRSLWLYGDTFSAGRFVHSTAIVQRGGCLHVSHGGAQLLPNRSSSVIYWIDSVRVVGGRVLVTAGEVKLTGTGAWDFRYNGFMATAQVAVDAAGDATFVRWVSRERKPAPDPGPMVVFGSHHFGYSIHSHPQARLASGKVLTTLAQNYDDGKVRPASAYRPIWLETDGQQATVVEMYR